MRTARGIIEQSRRVRTDIVALQVQVREHAVVLEPIGEQGSPGGAEAVVLQEELAQRWRLRECSHEDGVCVGTTATNTLVIVASAATQHLGQRSRCLGEQTVGVQVQRVQRRARLEGVSEHHHAIGPNVIACQAKAAQRAVCLQTVATQQGKGRQGVSNEVKQRRAAGRHMSALSHLECRR